MRRRNLFLILFLTLSVASLAQEKAKKIARPNIPGSFMIDLGFNRGIHAPANFSQGFWGSRSLNLYYQYPIRLWKSKFSFNPGIGLSMERFKFVKNRILYDTIEATDPAVQFELVRGSLLHDGIRKSMLVTNYLEIPIEFRFDTNPEDISRSFNLAIGGRIGVLYDSFNKIKYRENGEVKKLKEKNNLGLNPFRYGVYARLGIGGFNWFAFYNLSPLFQKDKGPDFTTMNTMTLGISINGF